MLASELGLDPIDIRRRNLVPADCIPYHVGTSVGPSRRCTTAATSPRCSSGRWRSRARAAHGCAGPERWRGFGIAAIAEPSGFGPFESARVEVEGDGTVRVFTGATSQGQGQETTLAQVCGEVLGLPWSRSRSSMATPTS